MAADLHVNKTSKKVVKQTDVKLHVVPENFLNKHSNSKTRCGLVYTSYLNKDKLLALRNDTGY